MDRDESITAAPPASAATLPLAARRHPLVALVARDLRERCGFAGAGPLVVGVSGGPDSVALLVATVVMRDRARSGAGPRPIATHVHHHLRGADADADAALVEALCTRLAVPFRIEHVRPADAPGNLAANARSTRYDALRRVAVVTGATAVSVAHHADDHLETMLMALGRGAGLDGFDGLPWTRDLGSGVRLLRPLLGARRAECVEFCRAAEADWREDASNDDRTKARTRLRHDVLPVLDELWPDAARRAVGTAETIVAAREAFAADVGRSFGPATLRSWHRDDLRDLGLPTITAGLRRAALDAAPAVADLLHRRTVDRVARLVRSADRAPHRFAWPGGLEVVVTARDVRIDRT